MYYLEEECQGASFPWVNHVLMGAMLCCFAYELTLGPAFRPFLTTYGWIPAQFSLALTQGQFPVSSSLFACLFLHGGGLHLVGNLLCLFFLGNAVEARLGAVRYLVLYLCGNVIALLTQAAMTPFSSTPMIGASGAIAAVAGVYCLVFFSPQEPATTAHPSPRPLEGASTILFLGGWVCFHVIGAIAVYALGETAFFSSASIAWGAHIGGFLGGLILGPLLLSSLDRRRRRPAVDIVPFLLNRPNSLLR